MLGALTPTGERAFGSFHVGSNLPCGVGGTTGAHV